MSAPAGRRTVIGWVGLGVVVLFATWIVWSAVQAAGSERPGLACAGRVYEFGEVEGDAVVEHVFVLENRGSEEVSGLAAMPDCGCMTASVVEGSVCFGGEESAGASFLRMDGSVWTTDKDGPLLGLLAAEITAKTKKDPGQHYQELTRRFGTPYYTRKDAPANAQERDKLSKLSAESVKDTELAGEKITAKLTKAPGNNAAVGGLKVVTESGWFAARPSGTEDVYKIYAESLKSETHLDAIVEQARALVSKALA